MPEGLDRLRRVKARSETGDIGTDETAVLKSAPVREGLSRLRKVRAASEPVAAPPPPQVRPGQVQFMDREAGYEYEVDAPPPPGRIMFAPQAPSVATGPGSADAAPLTTGVRGPQPVTSPEELEAANVDVAARVWMDRSKEVGGDGGLNRPPQTMEEAREYLAYVGEVDADYLKRNKASLYVRSLGRNIIQGLTANLVDPADVTNESPQERRGLEQVGPSLGPVAQFGQAAANIAGAVHPIKLLSTGLRSGVGGLAAYGGLSTPGGPSERIEGAARMALLGAVPNPFARSAGWVPRRLGGAASGVVGDQAGAMTFEGRGLTGQEAATSAATMFGLAGKPGAAKPRRSFGDRLRALRAAKDGAALPVEVAGEIKAEAVAEGKAAPEEVFTPARVEEGVRAAQEAVEAGLPPAEAIEAARVAVEGMEAADGPGGRQEGYRATEDVLADPAVPEPQKAAIREAEAQGVETVSSHVDPATGKGVAIGAQRETGEVRRVEEPEAVGPNRGLQRPADQPPEAWLMGATQARQRAGMGPREAVADAVREWRAQGEMEAARQATPPVEPSAPVPAGPKAVPARRPEQPGRVPMTRGGVGHQSAETLRSWPKATVVAYMRRLYGDAFVDGMRGNMTKEKWIQTDQKMGVLENQSAFGQDWKSSPSEVGEAIPAPTRAEVEASRQPEQAPADTASDFVRYKGRTFRVIDMEVEPNGKYRYRLAHPTTGAEIAPVTESKPLRSGPMPQTFAERIRAKSAAEGSQAGAVDVGAVVETARDVAQAGVGVARNVFGAEGQRATDKGGAVGQRMKRIGFEVETAEVESRRRLFPFFRRAAESGRRRGAASWAMTLDPAEGSGGRWTKGPRLERASQGSLEAPPEAAETVGAFRDLSEARWNEADRLGLQRSTKDGPMPYGQYERGPGGSVTLPRVFHSEGADVIKQGPRLPNGERNVAYENLAEGLKDLNPEMADLVDDFLTEAHQEGQAQLVGSGEQRSQFEFSRMFPEVPAAVLDHKGRMVHVLEVDPLNVARNIFERGSRRLGVLSVTGQDLPGFSSDPVGEAREGERLKAWDERSRRPDELDVMLTDELAAMGAGTASDGMSSMLHDLRAEYEKSGGNRAEFEKWVRDLHGVNPTKQAPESVASQRGWRVAGRMFALQKSLWQSGGAAIRNMTEFFPIASRLGLKNTAVAMVKSFGSKRSRDRALLNAAVRLDVARRNVDPNHPVGDFIDHLGRIIYEGFGSGTANRLGNEMPNAIAARSVLAGPMLGRPGWHARRRIETLLVNEGRMDRETAHRLAVGEGRPAEYAAAVRRLTANLTSGNLRPGERSAVENRRWFQRVSAFTRYPMSVIRDTGVQVSGGLRDIYRASEPGISKTERVARVADGMGTLLRWAGGRTAQGLTSAAITAFLRQGGPGLDNFIERFEDDPAGELLRAGVVSALTGFVGQAAIELTGDGGVSGAIGAVFSLPRWAGDVVSAMLGAGPYEGLEAGEVAEKMVKRAIPAARMLDTLATTAGMNGDKAKIRQEIEAAKTMHYDQLNPGRRWGRFPSPQPRNELDKPPEYRAGMSALYDAAMDQDFDKVFEAVDRLGGTDKAKREEIAASLRGRRIISSIRKDMREEWLGRMPERAARGLAMHDAILDMYDYLLRGNTGKAEAAFKRYSEAGGRGDAPNFGEIVRRVQAKR